MKNKTAVQWLIDQYEKKGYIGLQNELQAKEMEKNQIMDAFNYAQIELGMEADEYYEQTFKSEL